MSSNLDDFLFEINWKGIKKNKELLSLLREAYTCGVPAMIAKSLTDRLKEAGNYAFYLGTPPQELRRIASFLLTQFNNSPKIIINLLPALWKRHGREDAVLYGIILANINSKLLAENVWVYFSNCIRKQEPADDILSVCEELVRAKHPFPKINNLDVMVKRSIIHHQLVLFILFQKSRLNLELTAEELCFVNTCPGSNDLVIRIKSKILDD